jgi:hypothetical protein
MMPPTQLPLLFPDADPTVARPRTTLAGERERAFAASERYLNAIESRASNDPGIREDDRGDALWDVKRRRSRLARLRRSGARDA